MGQQACIVNVRKGIGFTWNRLESAFLAIAHPPNAASSLSSAIQIVPILQASA
ncbi:MAG: hypothetical protein LZF60_370023 [Nitrospira sp.]|nr:MAG: hypothetical protein LZF60_370023 [Nitrospira sp.]